VVRENRALLNEVQIRLVTLRDAYSCFDLEKSEIAKVVSQDHSMGIEIRRGIGHDVIGQP